MRVPSRQRSAWFCRVHQNVETMWLKEYLRNSWNTRFLKSNRDRRLLILPGRITDSTGLSWQKHRQRRQNASIFFDQPVLQYTESDQSKFCPFATLRYENIRKERPALQPLLLGPALQLGEALPTQVVTGPTKSLALHTVTCFFRFQSRNFAVFLFLWPCSFFSHAQWKLLMKKLHLTVCLCRHTHPNVVLFISLHHARVVNCKSES